MNYNIDMTSDFFLDNPNITMDQLPNVEYLENYERPFTKPLYFNYSYPDHNLRKILNDAVNVWQIQNLENQFVKIEPKLNEIFTEVKKLLRKPKIAFLGLSDAGKSSMINSLIGNSIMPSNWTPTTSFIIYIKHIEDRPKFMSGEVCVFGKDKFDLDWDENNLSKKSYYNNFKIEEGHYDILYKYTNQSNTINVSSIVVFVSSPLLLNCDIIDAPGLASGLNSDNEKATKVPTLADMVVYLSCANSFMQEADFNYVKLILKELANKKGMQEALKSMFIVASQVDTLNTDFDNQCCIILSNAKNRLSKVLSEEKIIPLEYVGLLENCFYGYSIYLRILARSKFEKNLENYFKYYYSSVQIKLSKFIKAAYNPQKKTIVNFYEFLLSYFMNSEELLKNNTLYCVNGEEVELLYAANDKIYVKYNNSEYNRPIEYLGFKFFISRPYTTDYSKRLVTNDKYHYDRYGYDKRGYNISGFNKDGFDIYGYDKYGYDKDGYNKNGFDLLGFNKSGLTSHGYDRCGYNSEGYDKQGYNKYGFDKYGYGIDGYNNEGYDKYGYGRDGYNSAGYDKRGYNKDGFDKKGFNRDGYNKEGYDINGFDYYGYNKEGFDKKGYNEHGYDKYGLNRELEFSSESPFRKILIVDKTKFYHKIFGEGLLKGLERDKNILLKIKFNKKEKISKFVFPECFEEKTLELLQSSSLKEMTDFMETTYGKDQLEKEKKNLKIVLDKIKVDLREADNKYAEARSERSYTDSGDWDKYLLEKNKKEFLESYNDKVTLTQMEYSPYFGRIDYNGETLYIGYNNYDNIIEWTDKRSAMFYEYQSYVGNEDFNLSMVRSIIINESKLYGILDKYNDRFLYSNDEKEIDNVITDSYLLKIIKFQKENKQSHDIISSIQNNQYGIISAPLSENLLVNGCAGSGKTMIILHRLKFISRNYSDFSIKNTVLLSPTNILLRENQAVANSLGIEKINSYSNNKLYLSICERIAKDRGIYFNSNPLELSNNNLIPKAILKNLYSCESLDEFLHRVSEVANNIENKRKIVEIIHEKNVVYLSKLVNFDSFNEIENNLHNSYDSFLSATKELSNMSFKNIESTLSNLEGLLLQKEEDIEKEIRIKKYWEHSEHTKASEMVEKSNRKIKSLTRTIDGYKHKISILKSVIEVDYPRRFFGSITQFYTKTVKGKTSYTNIPKHNISYYKNVFKFYDSLSNINFITDVSSPFETFETKVKPIMEIEQAIKGFENGNQFACLLEIAQIIIDDKKKELKIDLNKNYEWELFWKAYLCSKINTGLFDKTKLVFVDEVQDYAVSEISMIKSVFRQACFNYYGDFDQSINPKSMDGAEFKVEAFSNVKQYNISANYRNAKEVTEFINNKLNMQMTPIGLSGKVKIITVNDILSVPIESDDRVALVFRHTDVELPCDLKEKVNVISESDVEIKRGCINLISLSMVKGLEFEKVFVVTQGMNKNEQYVAMTRALNELYIVEDCDSKI